jgi:hypothetical protein
LETISAFAETYDTTIVVEPDSIEAENQPFNLVLVPAELAFEIGAWIAGIESFTNTCRGMFASEGRPGVQDLRREFRIVNGALLQMSTLCFRLRRTLDEADGAAALGVSKVDLDSFAALVRRSIVLGESLSTSRTLTLSEWQGWVGVLTNDLKRDLVARRLVTYSLENGYAALPSAMRDLFESPDVELVDRIDLHDVVPSVATALRYLDIVGRMMRSDEPLKPGLLILSAVHDQARRMIDRIDDRLARFPNEEAVLFNSLDSASYGASLEIKKVFQQELRGIVGVLPPTSVFARIETAYSLLLDSFQQILLDLARSVDPEVTLFDFFPRFQIKLDQSLILREHLWQILKAVRAAEDAPEKGKVDHLKQELADFVTITIRFLHYKDEETFERFSEEVHAGRDKKDLVPILHRFGAYLETLFGQVCMRGVLADHPFQRGT